MFVLVPFSNPSLFALERTPLRLCVGCDIVQADHAPDGGVAQGVSHGVLVRHHGRNQEEVEEGLGQEEEDAQETQVHMHGWDEMK